MSVTEYLTPRLFEPLGIDVPVWEKSPTGIEAGGWGLFLKTEDIAKLVVKLMAEEPDSFKNRFISALAKLSVEQWEVLESISNMMADSNAKKEE